MILKIGFTSIIITILLLIGCSVNCEEDSLFWKDFCPTGLENAQYKEIKWFWPEGSKATQEIYNYWADRRTEFQISLNKCNEQNSLGRTTCYETLKQQQKFYNEQYKKGVQQQQITRQDWRDIHEKGSSPFMINIFQK